MTTWVSEKGTKQEVLMAIYGVLVNRTDVMPKQALAEICREIFEDLDYKEVPEEID